MQNLWNGQTGRRGYLIASLLVILGVPLLAFALLIVGAAAMSWAVVFVFPVAVLLIKIPCFAGWIIVARRRLRDLDLSGVWLLLLAPSLLAFLKSLSFLPIDRLGRLWPIPQGLWMVVAFTALLGFVRGQLAGGPPAWPLLQWLRHWTHCKGRMDSLAFGRSVLPFVLAYFVQMLMFRYFPYVPGTSIRSWVLISTGFITSILSFLAIPMTVRRLHDLGLPGIFAMLFPIGIVAMPHWLLKMIYPIGQQIDLDLYHPAWSLMTEGLKGATLIFLLLVKGTGTTNRYGPPPRPNDPKGAAGRDLVLDVPRSSSAS